MDIVGEVIESSSAQFRAECARLHEPPALGSFVKVVIPGSSVPDDDPFDSSPHLPEGAIYAVVHSATTSSIDSGRRPTAYWKDEEELRREQPQIFQLLSTEFGGLIVGHSPEGGFQPGLPPRPARLHAPVSECATTEIRAITERPFFLRTLALQSDELIAAVLRIAAAGHPGDNSFIVNCGKELAKILGDDYDRLKAILDRIQPNG